MNKALMFSTGKDDWQTPPDLFASLDAEFHFDVDVAASADNAMCMWFFDEAIDALKVEWATSNPMLGAPPVCYCNPPYSRGLQGRFIAKAALERRSGVTTAMLIPARTDTRAFHEHIWNAETHQPREGVEVRFLKGRLKFSGAKDAAPFPSMVIIFRPKAKPQSLLENA